MKRDAFVFSSSKAWMICGILCVASISRSVHPQPTSTDPKKGASNPVPAIVQPTNSVFVIPHTEQEGRDPFFPKSRYIYAKAPVQTPTTNIQPVTRHAELKLQGISGPPNHRLPIINGRTFEVGEENEVPTPEGRVPVRVIEVKGDVVTVQAAGERQILKLRNGL